MFEMWEKIKKYLKQYYMEVIIIFLLLVVIGILVFKMIWSNSKKVDSNLVNDNEIIANLNESNDSDMVENKESKEVKKEVMVDIKGAVKHPGVYVLEEDNVINDVINLAGGLTKNASTDNINLSKKINNEMVIYIALKSELQKIVKEKEEKSGEVVLIPEVIGEKQSNVGSFDTFVNKENSVGVSVSDTNKSSNSDNNVKDKNGNINEDNGKNVSENVSKLININKATKEELQTLNGIGESKAEKIIEYRNNNGGFKNVDEIKNVSGIGDSAFEKIKDNITV